MWNANWRCNAATGEHIGSVALAGSDDPLAAYAGDRGAEVFRACVACHTLTPDEGNRAGPTLAGIFGRRIATLPGYNFSAPLKQLDIRTLTGLQPDDTVPLPPVQLTLPFLVAAPASDATKL